MVNAFNYRAWLAGAAIGLLLALIILPTTRPLLSVQMAQVFGLQQDMFGVKAAHVFGLQLDMFGKTRDPASIAMAHPDDVQIQLATAQQASQSAFFSTTTSGVGADYVGALKSVGYAFPMKPLFTLTPCVFYVSSASLDLALKTLLYLA